MKPKPNKFFASLPIIISLVALVVSIYSVKLSIESHYINKTQVLFGKKFEILSLMIQLSELKNTESLIVRQIIWTYKGSWTYDGSPTLLDKEEVLYSSWKKKEDEIRDEINKEQEMLDNIFILFDKKGNDIEMLEAYVGLYKLKVSSAVSSKDHAKKHLDELEKKLLKVDLDNINKEKEAKHKTPVAGDSTR